MATVTANGTGLLKAVQQLGPDEFDTFLEQAISLRERPRGATLSAKESKLIQKINRGLPEALCRRYARLSHRRKKGSLSGDQRAELLKLTHEFESRDAERAAALLELAKLRRVPIRLLMKRMGIKAAPVHG
jgi:hypothetical protein